MTQKLVLTRNDINTLRCAGRAGKNFEEACREIGYHRRTVRAALASQELEWELKDVFKFLNAPTEAGILGYRKLKPEHIEGHPVQTRAPRWLTVSWMPGDDG